MQSFISPSRSLLIVTSTLLRVGAFTKSTPLYHNLLSRSMDRCKDSLFKSFSSFDDDFVGMQKKVGENDSIATTSTIENHLSHQKKVFDEMATFFDSEEATPEEVKPVLRYLVKKTLNQIKTAKDNDEDKIFKILDVGCGTGALFPYYLEAANELQIRLNIVGLDLSPKMVEYATENSIKMLSGSDDGSRHDIRCEAGDFVKTVMGVDYCEKSLTGFENGVVDEKTEKFREEFDAVVINACFGNFLDQDSVVMAAGSSLKIDGVFVISHPLGSAFVEKLRKDNPSTVPNPLPTEDKFNDLLEFQPFAKMDFTEKGTVSDGVEDDVTLFYASSKRVHHRILREVVRLRGDVDEGYGRGGKKLGFPTANLPSSLFANALTNVPTGVYFGWVVIEDSLNDEKKGRNVVHKAVVNVGYSPTFEGKENKEKIVEAHLIVENGDIEGDFYGETMRLALCGFLRPEKRFPSFPDLIAAITNDVANAKKFLDSVPYSNFSKDDFLQNPTEQWVGSSGGDDGASYEFTSTNKFLGK